MRRPLALALALAACGDSTSTPDTSTSTSTSTPDTSVTTTPDIVTPTDSATAATDTTDTTDTADTSGPTASAVTGVAAPASPKPEPTPNAACATAGNTEYAATDGFTYPWEGVERAGTSYTCNGCATGIAALQGHWRVHGTVDDKNDYSAPDPATDYAELLEADGNTFEVHIADQVADSDTTYRGFYFCSQEPEDPTADIFWIVTESDGIYFAVGDIIITQPVLVAGADNLQIAYLDEPGSSHMLAYDYCRIGTKNPDDATQTCTDPFAQ